MPDDKLFLTALPNGTLGNAFRLSLFLTPSLVDNGSLHPPFNSWPDTARNLSWTVGFYTTAHAPIGNPIGATRDPDSPPDFDVDLWAQVFAGVRVRHRQSHRHFNDTWRLSHNISKLHQRHSCLRLAHAYQQVADANNVDASAEIQPLLDSSSVPRIFLHPKFQSNVAQQYDERTDALTQLTNLVNTLPAPYNGTVGRRVDHGTKRLENYGGAPLSAVALSALYRAAFQSVVLASQSNPAVAAAIAVIQSWFPARPASPRFPATPGDLDTVQHYVQLLLFHNRQQPQAQCKIDPPDFHQLLGLVHNYPSILRPLGLVYDLTVPRPANLPANFAVTINLANDAAGNQLRTLVDVSSVYTLSTFSGNSFFATPSDPNLIQSGLLNLQAPGKSSANRFSLVSEAADGHAIKRTDQTNSAERADEFQSSAPTSMRATPAPPATGMHATPSGTPPPSADPTSQTVGLALFDEDRLIEAEQSASRYPNTPDGSTPLPPTDFYAEDLILGYRVDILYKQNFYSLCERQSAYDIFAPRSTHLVKTWTPQSTMEKYADEGFISFGASQSVIDPQGPQNLTDPNYSDNSITQIHQAVFTWIGWSLSVPPLKGFPQMNPPATPPAPDCTAVNNQHLAIQPRFQLKDGFKLPPLRFNTDYTVRCRVVDLAGNSAPPTLDPHNAHYSALTIRPETPFSLHEPIRAPHFLLLQPIDRVHEPGTHVNRIVVREEGEVSARMLVPPRESLRLAELWGLLKSDKLPPSAFGVQQLLEDGSFPSVACLKEKGWLNGAIQSPGDNDAIFIKRKFGDEPKNPFYPDPLARFVRVEVYQLSDDPNQSKLLSTHYLDILQGHSWPECLPARIRVTATSEGDPTTSLVQDDDLDVRPLGLSSVPTLEIKIPEACTLVLKIRSAAARSDAPEPDARQNVHLTHVARLHLTSIQAMSVLTGAAGRPTTQAKLAAAAAALRTPLTASNPFVDGTVEMSTPSRTMTVVRPVRRPLDRPEFAPDASAGFLKVIRYPGKAEALVTGQLRAHWPSTAKITCFADWTDQVDDLNQPGPQPVRHREVAFVATARELMPDTPWPASRLRDLQNGVLQHFLDTRAHDVTYSLVASTNFREYFPGTDPTGGDPHFQRDGVACLKLTVASSVRPLAPKLSYLIPAFLWTNSYDPVQKNWYTGRTVMLRAYFERPFLLSGNRETVGVVLFDPTSGVDPAKQNYVSRWGADPVRPITKPILQNELSEINLCEAGHPLVTCRLPEGDQARIKPCSIHYSPERELWYADVPINTLNTNTSFVRLAFARFQPDSLTGGASEARSSQVVFAEFMQLSPDRWVSVHKRSGSKFSIAISGAFANDPANNPFTFTLQQRWYAIGRDMGWRPAQANTTFVFTPADSSGVATWSAELETKHSAYTVKCRLLIQERELPGDDRRKSFSMFVNLP